MKNVQKKQEDMRRRVEARRELKALEKRKNQLKQRAARKRNQRERVRLMNEIMTKAEVVKELRDNLANLLCSSCDHNRPTVNERTATLGPCEGCKEMETRAAKYGIGLDKYKKLYVKQKGRCAICDEQFTETPSIDHCHNRNHVRGLLCRGCNTGLGMFKDKLVSLENATKYLKENAFSAKWSAQDCLLTRMV